MLEIYILIFSWKVLQINVSVCYFVCLAETESWCVVMCYIQNHMVAVHTVAKHCADSIKSFKVMFNCKYDQNSETNLEGGRHTHDVEFLLTHPFSWINNTHKMVNKVI